MVGQTNLQCGARFFFFSLFDVERSLGFFSPTLSLYRSIARVFLERENVKKTDVKRLGFFSCDVF